MRHRSGHGKICSRWEEWLQRLAIGDLPKRMRSRLARHLMACRDCREYLRRARSLPRWLAGAARVDAPPDLAEQIKTACLLSRLMAPRPRPARLLAPLSLAGATAAAAVLIAVVTFSYLPQGTPVVAAAPKPKVAAVRIQPAPVVETRDIAAAQPETRVIHSVATPRATRVRTAAPRVVLAAYHPTTPRRHVSPTVIRPIPAASAPVPAQAARPRAYHGGVVSGIGGFDAASVAAAALHHAEANTEVDKDGDVNSEVAQQVVAGAVAGAVIEKYLASAIASRGAAMTATDVAYDASFSPDDAVYDDYGDFTGM